jgi:hypothetical protein
MFSLVNIDPEKKKSKEGIGKIGMGKDRLCLCLVERFVDPDQVDRRVYVYLKVWCGNTRHQYLRLAAIAPSSSDRFCYNP